MSPSLPVPVLVDSSVWIGHFRRANSQLADLLESGQVMMHDFVLGELVLGALPRRHAAYTELRALPLATRATHDEVIDFVLTHRLEDSGIGWVDAHVVASVMIDRAALWTLDKRLAQVAERMDIAIRA